jgi:hypothetical protein
MADYFEDVNQYQLGYAQGFKDGVASRSKTKRTKNQDDKTTNPYGHPFPHHKCKNVFLTPRLIGPQTWSPRGIPNNDIRNHAYPVDTHSHLC